MDVERRTVAVKRVNKVIAASMRWRNVSIFVRLAVHNAVLVPTIVLRQQNVGIKDEE